MNRLALTLLTALSLAACAEPPPKPRVITGLVDATELDVASKIAGRVKAVNVKPGDKVKAGQVLVTLTSQEIQAKLDQIQALIDASEAKLKLAKAGARREEISAVRDQLQSAKSQVEVTRKMYDRTKALLAQKAIPEAQFEEVDFKFKVAKDQLAQAEAKYSIVRKGARDEEVEALEALVRQAQGTQAEVKVAEEETSQVAPIDAEVAEVILHPGELAATGYPILTLVDLSDLWISFPVREDLLPKLAKGTRIQVELPALGKTIEAEVFHLAVMGDFATWKATNEKNSFDLKSFEVRARPLKPVEGLRPGMTARLKVE